MIFIILILIIIQTNAQTVKQSKYWTETNNVIQNTSTTYKSDFTDWSYRMSYYSTGN